MAKIYAMLIIVALIVGVAIGQSGNRFASITKQQLDGGNEWDEYVTVIHDKDTGQEVICYYRYHGYSSATGCWLTGRNWK